MNTASDDLLTALSLPQLTSIADNLIVSNTELSELSLPLLTSVGGDLYVHENAQLNEISMPELTSVGTELYVYANALNSPLPFGQCDIQAQLDAGNGIQCGGD